jgi:hypothetical protein
MTRFPIVLALALAALTACATVPATASPVHAIAYETGPCFGACPVYRVTVNSDGSGTFEGRRFTTVIGARGFRVTPEQYRAFARQLEPLRPDHGTVRFAGEACETMATDLPSAEVTWRSAEGEQRLYFYYGCDMDRNRALAERLSAAPGLLPIGDLISQRE